MRIATIDCAEIAQSLRAFSEKPAQTPVLIGFDGYVDKLVRPRRTQEAEGFFDTVHEFAERLLDMGGTSSDIAVTPLFEKIGGNGPLLAEALSEKAAVCSCIGAMGLPDLTAHYRPLAQKVRLYSVAESATSYALEFNDGKIMLGDAASFGKIGWQELQDAIGREKLFGMFENARLVCFTNWSGLPRSAELLEGILADICPRLTDGKTRTIFFDLADPTAKSPAQFAQLFSALDALRQSFECVVGLNPKECLQIYNRFFHTQQSDFSAQMLTGLLQAFPADELVIHDAGCAYAGRCGDVPQKIQGRFLGRPLISVGAGDNFNSGYCLGKLCGLAPEACAALGNESAVRFMEQGSPATLNQLLETFEHKENEQ